VIALQERVARLMGKEAACFVPSGTMANQTAIRAHTEPGDEVICHEDSHIIHYETGSPAALSGVMVRPLGGERGQFEAADVEGAVRPAQHHYAASRLLIVENTHNRGGGSVWPLERIEAVTAAARRRGLRCHLDGARIWNASAATGIEPAAYARHFDTVSCCFSKGLGAPAGSAVAGGAAVIARVHRFRKMFGGTMRQSGVLAAACIHALDRHAGRLGEDHARARRLAALIAETPGLRVPQAVETNMVFVDIDPRLGTAADLCAALRQRGVLALPNLAHRVRLVLHLDVTDAGVERAGAAISDCVAAMGRV
jgi:threonine aldolase